MFSATYLAFFRIQTAVTNATCPHLWTSGLRETAPQWALLPQQRPNEAAPANTGTSLPGLPWGRPTATAAAVDSNSKDEPPDREAVQCFPRRWHRELLHQLPAHHVLTRGSQPCSTEPLPPRIPTLGGNDRARSISTFTSDNRLVMVPSY